MVNCCILTESVSQQNSGRFCVDEPGASVEQYFKCKVFE